MFHHAFVFAAMQEEIAQIQTLKEHRLLHRIHPMPATGVGKIQAALAVQTALSMHTLLNNLALCADAIILIGSAGGIAEGLTPGDVVISTDTMFHDVDASPLGFVKGEIPFTGQSIWQADRTLVDIAHKTCHALGLTPKLGRMLTGDRFVSDSTEKKTLATEYQGLTVDWETAAAAFVAERAQIPWVSIRIVSDSADSEAGAEFQRNLRPIARTLLEIIVGLDEIQSKETVQRPISYCI